MKKNILFLFLLLSASTVFSQQFLWTTSKADTTVKLVSVENVMPKVLEFYDYYDHYYDGSGWSKEGFFKIFEGAPAFKNTDWKALRSKIEGIDSMTVLAFKSNTGRGSEILILCINKKNIDLIRFSNSYEPDAIFTNAEQREKFTKWFKTLLE